MPPSQPPSSFTTKSPNPTPLRHSALLSSSVAASPTPSHQLTVLMPPRSSPPGPPRPPPAGKAMTPPQTMAPPSPGPSQELPFYIKTPPTPLTRATSPPTPPRRISCWKTAPQSHSSLQSTGSTPRSIELASRSRPRMSMAGRIRITSRARSW